MNPPAVIALVVLTPLALGSLYQLLTAGASPMSIIGLVALLAVIGAIKRLRDDRRESRPGDLG